jgi:hypothetical protein
MLNVILITLGLTGGLFFVVQTILLIKSADLGLNNIVPTQPKSYNNYTAPHHGSKVKKIADKVFGTVEPKLPPKVCFFGRLDGEEFMKEGEPEPRYLKYSDRRAWENKTKKVPELPEDTGTKSEKPLLMIDFEKQNTDMK